jgi:septal ring factor EnvC (AmiA/AmiB activator)
MKLLHVPPVTLVSRVRDQLQQLKREVERLTIRHGVVERTRRRLAAHLTSFSTDEDCEDTAAMLNTAENLAADIENYISQVRDRLAHIEQGLTAAQTTEAGVATQLFLHYILEDARLWGRDVSVARAGYDTLIASMLEESNQFDV